MRIFAYPDKKEFFNLNFNHSSQPIDHHSKIVRVTSDLSGITTLWDIAVGQWLVAGLHWSSSARQSLAARQKELSEQYKLILKRQNCIENGLNLCNFLTSFSSFFYLSFLLSIFFLFFAFFSLFFCLQCTTEPDCTTKWAFTVKARKARALRRCWRGIICSNFVTAQTRSDGITSYCFVFHSGEIAQIF